MDKKLLWSKIKLNGDNLMTLSEYLGITNTTLSNKINEKAEFDQGEIKAIKKRYKLMADEVDAIFFS